MKERIPKVIEQSTDNIMALLIKGKERKKVQAEAIGKMPVPYI